MISKILTAIAALSFTLQVSAQTCGILLYNTDGRKFKAYTNGTLQNVTPMSELRLCCFPMDIVKVKLEFEDRQIMEKTLYLRRGYLEHHRVTDKKIVFDSYEEMPSEYANITNVTVINVSNCNGTSPMTITTTAKSNSCNFPISDRSFYEFYGHLKNQSFDSDKLTEAKNAVKRDCFTSKQIKTALGAFTYESSRLDFARFAYQFVHDKGAYSIVKEGFKFTIGNELDEYINKR